MNPQARLGAFVLIALILLGIVSSKIGGVVWFKQKQHVVEAEFSDLQGLEVQAPVLMAGVKVGFVQEILLRNNRAVVRIALRPDVRLPASTVAFIGSRGMVGEKYLGLRAKPGDKALMPDGAVIPSQEGGDINMLFNKLARVADDIGGLMQGLNQLLVDEKATASIKNTLAHIDEAASRLSSVVDENQADLARLVANLREGSESLQKELPGMLKEVKQASAAGADFFTAGKKAIEEIDGIIIDNRENLYRMIFEFRKAAENLEALSDDLRRNPWKLTFKRPEVPPSPRAREEKMEELLLTTGRMGIAPARR